MPVTVPDVTDGFNKLIEMRRLLGWVTEIPRHGPGVKKKMESLKDFDDEEKVKL